MEQTQEPTSEEIGDVELSGLAEALGFGDSFPPPEAKTNEEVTPTTEEANVPTEGVEAAEVAEKTEVEETPVEPKTEEEEGKLPESVQKRIDKLTAEKYSAQEKIEQLTQQLAQAQTNTVQVPVDPNQPLANVQSHTDLSKMREQALSVKEWALMNMDGGTYTTTEKDGSSKDVFLDSAQVRELLVKSSRMLDRDIPARKEYLDATVGHFNEAKKYYPQLFENTPDAQMANKLIQMAPWVKNFPDWPVIVGDLLAGMKSRQAKATKAPAPSPDVTKPKIIGSPKGQAGPRVKSSQSVAEYAKNSKDNTISVMEAANLLDSLL